MKESKQLIEDIRRHLSSPRHNCIVSDRVSDGDLARHHRQHHFIPARGNIHENEVLNGSHPISSEEAG